MAEEIPQHEPLLTQIIWSGPTCFDANMAWSLPAAVIWFQGYSYMPALPTLSQLSLASTAKQLYEPNQARKGEILLRSAGERVLLKKTLRRFIEKTLKLSRCADASSKVAFIKIFSKVVDWNCVIIDTWLYSAEKCNSIQKQSSYCPQIRYKKENKVHNLS